MLTVENLTLGQVIRVCRERKEMRKSELAKRLSVTNQYIGDMEKDRAIPSSEKIDLLAGVLEIDRTYLYKLANKLPDDLIEQIKREYYAKAVNPF